MVDLSDDSTNENLEDNLIECANPKFIIHIPNEISTNSQEYSDMIFIENQNEEDYSPNISNINLIGNRRDRRTRNPNIQHSLTKNDCRMAKIEIGYYTFLIIFINTFMQNLKLNIFFFKLMENLNV